MKTVPSRYFTWWDENKRIHYTAKHIFGIACTLILFQFPLSAHVITFIFILIYVLTCAAGTLTALVWRHKEHDGGSHHQPHDCLLNRLFRRRSKKTWKLRVTGLCAGNSPVTEEFPTQRASNAENASIWWRHQGAINCSGNWTPDSIHSGTDARNQTIAAYRIG